MDIVYTVKHFHGHLNQMLVNLVAQPGFAFYSVRKFWKLGDILSFDSKLAPVFQNTLQNKWVPWKQTGFFGKYLENRYMTFGGCLLCSSSRPFSF